MTGSGLGEAQGRVGLVRPQRGPGGAPRPGAFSAQERKGEQSARLWTSTFQTPPTVWAGRDRGSRTPLRTTSLGPPRAVPPSSSLWSPCPEKQRHAHSPTVSPSPSINVPAPHHPPDPFGLLWTVETLSGGWGRRPPTRRIRGSVLLRLTTSVSSVLFSLARGCGWSGPQNDKRRFNYIMDYVFGAILEVESRGCPRRLPNFRCRTKLRGEKG